MPACEKPPARRADAYFYAQPETTIASSAPAEYVVYFFYFME
jgi:hypothetical protein